MGMYKMGNLACVVIQLFRSQGTVALPKIIAEIVEIQYCTENVLCSLPYCSPTYVLSLDGDDVRYVGGTVATVVGQGRILVVVH